MRKIKSSICLDDILDIVQSRIISLWPDIHPHEVIVKANGEIIKNPFTDQRQGTKKEKNAAVSDPGSVERVIKSKEHILEGHAVEILRPDMMLDVDGTVMVIKIMESFKVDVIKQRLLKHPDFPVKLKAKLTL